MEEDDPTRLCALCRLRPRWSRHGNCSTCVQCGRPAKHLKRRKLVDRIPLGFGSDERVYLQRARRTILRELGASPDLVRRGFGTNATFMRALGTLGFALFLLLLCVDGFGCSSAIRIDEQWCPDEEHGWYCEPGCDVCSCDGYVHPTDAGGRGECLP